METSISDARRALRDGEQMEHRKIHRRTLSFCSVACMFKRLLQEKGLGDTEGRSKGLGLAIID
jgi:hypothetical protein